MSKKTNVILRTAATRSIYAFSYNTRARHACEYQRNLSDVRRIRETITEPATNDTKTITETGS